MYIPEIFKQFPNLITAESNRLGGISEHPYSSLNLGIYTKDRSDNVIENKNIFFNSLNIKSSSIADSHQIHSYKILYANQSGHYEGYDALVTNKPGINLCVTVADCTPILIYDAKNKIVCAIHAGWRGTVEKIVLKTLNYLQQTFKTKGGDCFAYIGTCIDKDSFEVGEEVALYFSDNHKYFVKEKNKYFVDLKEANKTQLTSFSIPENQIEISTFSTVLNNDKYFSFRKENGLTGRMIALIGMID